MLRSRMNAACSSADMAGYSTESSVMSIRQVMSSPVTANTVPPGPSPGMSWRLVMTPSISTVLEPPTVTTMTTRLNGSR